MRKKAVIFWLPNLLLAHMNLPRLFFVAAYISKSRCMFNRLAKEIVGATEQQSRGRFGAVRAFPRSSRLRVRLFYVPSMMWGGNVVGFWDFDIELGLNAHVWAWISLYGLIKYFISFVGRITAEWSSCGFLLHISNEYSALNNKSSIALRQFLHQYTTVVLLYCSRISWANPKPPPYCAFICEIDISWVCSCSFVGVS